MSGSRRPRWWLPLVLVVVFLPLALVLLSQHEPLPSPEEGEGLVVAAAQRDGHPGSTAWCRVIGERDPSLGCRMRDADGRYGWGSVRVDETWVEGYRGRTPQDVVRTTVEFPVDAGGVAVLDAVVPDLGPGPTGSTTMAGVLMFALRAPLEAAGYDATLPGVRCPPVPEGGSVACTVAGIPATVTVTRGAGAEHRIHLTVTPRP
ncbi:hypothetical protein WIS52_17515 [Pseudonocardia nematodicida]|uniref:DUF4333 domain-containing protein n=1 Tax=Pseudonocardia nematodicida TaxID=1206997 RepID=A0ABV1KEH3_9PSEU